MPMRLPIKGVRCLLSLGGPQRTCISQSTVLTYSCLNSSRLCLAVLHIVQLGGFCKQSRIWVSRDGFLPRQGLHVVGRRLTIFSMRDVGYFLFAYHRSRHSCS